MRKKECGNIESPIIVTAGSSYLDIDAYACCIAMCELLNRGREKAVAFSRADYNYSVCQSLITEDSMNKSIPSGFQNAKYIVVDVSNPDFIMDAVPLEQVIAVYDHHVGFEEFWENRIGDYAHIEFIGAAAALIYREWKASGQFDQMNPATARLLVAAILDNTLNLSSSNTTQKDIDAFHALCAKGAVDERWCASYFCEVQKSIEADLQEALFKDVKTIEDNRYLPSIFAQLCIWNSKQIIERMDEIRKWFNGRWEDWLLNLIDIQNKCGVFVCDNAYYQRKLEGLFDIHFEKGVAILPQPYLRKEILKKTKIEKREIK